MERQITNIKKEISISKGNRRIKEKSKKENIGSRRKVKLF